MSDVQINDNDDNAEEGDSEEEIAAAENIDLRSFGIEPLTTPIEDLLKLYRDNHAIVTEYTEKKKSGKSDPTDVSNVIKSNLEKALKSDEMKERLNSVRDEFKENATEYVFSAGFTLVTAACMLQEAENLVSLLKDEMRYHFDNAVQNEKTKQGIVNTPSESALVAKLVCTKLRNLIENRVNIAQMMGESLPTDLLKPAEPGKRGGFNTKVFPRSPRLDLGDYTPSNVTVSHLAFRFENTHGVSVEIPDGSTLRQVAHDVVSSGSYRVTGQEIERRLKKEGHGIGATKEEWSLSFDTGTLYGKAVSG